MDVCAKIWVLASIYLGGEAEINPNAQHWIIGSWIMGLKSECFLFLAQMLKNDVKVINV